MLLARFDGWATASWISGSDSVADAYRRVATTAYFSQCPSKDEWIGYAGIVTGDELLLNIRSFGEKYSISGTAVQGYFGISTTVSLLQSKALAMSSSLFKEEYRTYAQAEQWWRQQYKPLAWKLQNKPDILRPLIIASRNMTLNSL